MKSKDNKQQLFEMMGKLNPSFKPGAKLLTEWNFDKKKGEDKDDKEEKDSEKKDEKKETSGKKKWNFEKKEDKESEEHEESETPEEEKEEHEDKKKLKETDNVGKKVPVVCWDKAKHGK
jgi:hypothetical protein